jgi:prepilin-type N-terminal cleavage/methylation domain-containing protein
MVRGARKSSSGFTVIELMIALVIIGIMAATIAPSLTEVVADNRQASAAMDIVRLARHTRAQANATGTAHLLRYNATNAAAGAFELGTISTYVGMNSKCMQTPWPQTFVPAVGSGQGPVDLFHMGDYNPTDGETAPHAADGNRHVIALTSQFASTAGAVLAETRICYQPNGDIYTGTNGALTIQTAPVLITIARTINGAARGQTRQVLFPVGGNARLR